METTIQSTDPLATPEPAPAPAPAPITPPIEQPVQPPAPVEPVQPLENKGIESIRASLPVYNPETGQAYSGTLSMGVGDEARRIGVAPVKDDGFFVNGARAAAVAYHDMVSGFAGFVGADEIKAKEQAWLDWNKNYRPPENSSVSGWFGTQLGATIPSMLPSILVSGGAGALVRGLGMTIGKISTQTLANFAIKAAGTGVQFAQTFDSNLARIMAESRGKLSFEEGVAAASGITVVQAYLMNGLGMAPKAAKEIAYLARTFGNKTISEVTKKATVRTMIGGQFAQGIFGSSVRQGLIMDASQGTYDGVMKLLTGNDPQPMESYLEQFKSGMAIGGVLHALTSYGGIMRRKAAADNMLDLMGRATKPEPLPPELILAVAGHNAEKQAQTEQFFDNHIKAMEASGRGDLTQGVVFIKNLAYLLAHEDIEAAKAQNREARTPESYFEDLKIYVTPKGAGGMMPDAVVQDFITLLARPTSTPQQEGQKTAAILKFLKKNVPDGEAYFVNVAHMSSIAKGQWEVQMMDADRAKVHGDKWNVTGERGAPIHQSLSTFLTKLGLRGNIERPDAARWAMQDKAQAQALRMAGVIDNVPVKLPGRKKGSTVDALASVRFDEDGRLSVTWKLAKDAAKEAEAAKKAATASPTPETGKKAKPDLDAQQRQVDLKRQELLSWNDRLDTLDAWWESNFGEDRTKADAFVASMRQGREAKAAKLAAQQEQAKMGAVKAMGREPEGSVFGQPKNRRKQSKIKSKADVEEMVADTHSAGLYHKGTKAMAFFGNADSGTVVHEYMHHFIQNDLLPNRYMIALSNKYCPQDDKGRRIWTREAHERAANDMLLYLSKEQMPEIADPDVKNAFNFIAATVKQDIYSHAKGRLAFNEKAWTDPVEMAREIAKLDAAEAMRRTQEHKDEVGKVEKQNNELISNDTARSASDADAASKSGPGPAGKDAGANADGRPEGRPGWLAGLYQAARRLVGLDGEQPAAQGPDAAGAAAGADGKPAGSGEAGNAGATGQRKQVGAPGRRAVAERAGASPERIDTIAKEHGVDADLVVRAFGEEQKVHKNFTPDQILQAINDELMADKPGYVAEINKAQPAEQQVFAQAKSHTSVLKPDDLMDNEVLMPSEHASTTPELEARLAAHPWLAVDRITMKPGEVGKGIQLPNEMIYDMTADPDGLYARAAEKYADPQQRFSEFERLIAQDYLAGRSAEGVHLYHPIPADQPILSTAQARAIVDEQGITKRTLDRFDGTNIAPGREPIDPSGDQIAQRQVVNKLRRAVRGGDSIAEMDGIHEALEHYPASSVRNHLIDSGVHPDVAEAQVLHAVMDRYAGQVFEQPRAKTSSKEDERVVAAAIRVDGKVHTGPNHAIATWNALDKGVYKKLGINTENFEVKYAAVIAATEDGFVTSTGRFVSREEAKKIADAQNQTNTSEYEKATGQVKGWLNSEDMGVIAQAAAKHMDAIGYSAEDGRMLGAEVVENAKIEMHDELFPTRYEFTKQSQSSWRYFWENNTIVMDSRDSLKNNEVINSVKNFLYKNGFPEADEARVIPMDYQVGNWFGGRATPGDTTVYGQQRGWAGTRMPLEMTTDVPGVAKENYDASVNALMGRGADKPTAERTIAHTVVQRLQLILQKAVRKVGLDITVNDIKQSNGLFFDGTTLYLSPNAVMHLEGPKPDIRQAMNVLGRIYTQHEMLMFSKGLENDPDTHPVLLFGTMGRSPDAAFKPLLGIKGTDGQDLVSGGTVFNDEGGAVAAVAGTFRPGGYNAWEAQLRNPANIAALNEALTKAGMNTRVIVDELNHEREGYYDAQGLRIPPRSGHVSPAEENLFKQLAYPLHSAVAEAAGREPVQPKAGVYGQSPARLTLDELKQARDRSRRSPDITQLVGDHQPDPAVHGVVAGILREQMLNSKLTGIPAGLSEKDVSMRIAEGVIAQAVHDFGPEVVSEQRRELTTKGTRYFMDKIVKNYLLSTWGKEHTSDLDPEVLTKVVAHFGDVVRLGMKNMEPNRVDAIQAKWRQGVEPMKQELLAANAKALHFAPGRANDMGGAGVVERVKNGIIAAAHHVGATTFNLRNIAMFLDDGQVGAWTKHLWDDGINAAQTKASQLLSAYQGDVINVGQKNNWLSPQEAMLRIKLDTGNVYTMDEMRDLYAKAQFGKGDYLQRRDVNGWLVSNNPTMEAGKADLNAIIKHIQSDPSLRTRIEHQATWMSDKSKLYYRAACDVAEALGFERPQEIEGIYVPMRREGSEFHDAFSKIFDITPKAGDKPGSRQLLGQMKEREGGYGPKVMLDFNSNYDYAIRSTINYASKALTVNALRSMLSSKEIHQSLTKRFGDESFYSAIVQQVEKEMSPSGRTDPPITGDGALRWMRHGIYNSFLGFNWVSTPVTQLTSTLDGLAAIGLNATGIANATSEAASLMKWMVSRPKEALIGGSRHILEGNETWTKIKELSPSIVQRTIDPYAEGLRGATRGGFLAKVFPWWGSVAEKGTTLMQNMDLITVVSTWRGMFEMVKERLAQEHPEYLAEIGKIDKMAAREAERAVQETQNPSTPSELSLMQGGTEWKRMWNMFSSQGYILWQRNMNNFVLPVARAIQGGEGVGGKIGGAVKTVVNPNYLYKVGVGVALPGLMIATIGLRRLPKKDELINVLPLYAMMNIPLLGGYIWGSAMLGFGSGHDTFLGDVMGTIPQAMKSPGKALLSLGAVAGVPLTPVKMGMRAWDVYWSKTHEQSLRYILGWEGKQGTTEEPIQ